VARTFAEPATTWKGAILRATSWSGPHVCGSFLVGQFVPKSWHAAVMYGLLFVLIPALLAAWYRSWRVGLLSAAVAAVVVAMAFAVVMVMMKAMF
jgi:predicted outer membrane lipoprotein